MLENLDAVLLVDKPAGIAFSSVVKTVKRKFNLVKVGHGGSLDASASGLLVLLVNDANKFVGDVMGADRTYEGTLRIGLATDTGDIQGRKVDAPKSSSPIPDSARIEAALSDFRGDVFQTEPRFCSVRKEGSAEYTVADTGEHSQFLAHVYRLQAGQPGAANADGTVSVPFTLSATKGLIVRALAKDLGESLGCGACLESLRRTGVGRFKVGDAVPFDRLLETDVRDFASLTIPLSRAFV